MNDNVVYVDFNKNNDLKQKFKKIKRLLNESPADYNNTEISRLVREVEKELLNNPIV